RPRTAPPSTPLQTPPLASRPSLIPRRLLVVVFVLFGRVRALTVALLGLAFGCDPPRSLKGFDELVGVILQLRRFHHRTYSLRREFRSEVATAIVRKALVDGLPDDLDSDLSLSEHRQKRPPEGGVQVCHFVGAETD